MDDNQAIRFFEVAGQFGQEFVGGDADGAGEVEAMLNPGLKEHGNVFCRPVKLAGSGYVHKGFVDREGFNEVSVFSHHLHNFGGGMGVAPVIADDENQIGAETTGLVDRHAGLDSECPCLVGRCGYDGPVRSANYSDRLSEQRRVHRLFY